MTTTFELISEGRKAKTSLDAIYTGILLEMT